MNATSTVTSQTSSFIAGISSKAVLIINKEEALMQVSWTSAPTPSEVAECADSLTAIIRQYNLSQLLHDVRQVDYVNIDLQRCLTHVFCPKVMAAGIIKMVHLTNYTLPDLFIIDQIIDTVKKRYAGDRTTQFEICTTFEGATEWFKNNAFRQPVVLASEKEEVQVENSTAVALNEFSPLNALVRAYKEKVTLLYNFLFNPKAFYSNL